MSRKPHICEWCNSTLSNKWNLDQHQKTPKCIKKQDEKKQDEKKQITNIITGENKIDDQVSIIGNQNNTTINKNNINNNIKFSIDLSDEHMKKIAQLITEDILMKETGLSDFYEKHVARNERGELGMINTNKKEPMFNYKDIDGNMMRNNGIYMTKNFDKHTEFLIKLKLKIIKKFVVDLIDYKEIYDNIKNNKKMVKTLGESLYSGTVVITKKDPDGDEILDDPGLTELKNELEDLKQSSFKKEYIFVDFDNIKMENVNKTKKYPNHVKRKMKISINDKELEEKISTFQDERDDYERRVIEQKKVIFDIEKKRKIKIKEKQIRDYNPKWYMKKRLNIEMKEQIKNQKKIKKENTDIENQSLLYAKEEMYES